MNEETSMETSDIVARFDCIYLGDSLLEELTFRTAEAQCSLRFHAGSLLAGPEASIFEPVARYKPALLRLDGVRSVQFEGAPAYQLNATVVDFGARPVEDGHVEYHFDLTGGADPDAFLVKLKIVARDFAFGPEGH
jgi:hypothetical protein